MRTAGARNPLGVARRRPVGNAVPGDGAHARAGVPGLGAACVVFARPARNFATSGFRPQRCWRGSMRSIGSGPCPIGKSRNHCRTKSVAGRNSCATPKTRTWLAAGTRLGDAARVAHAGRRADRPRPRRFPARQYSLRRGPRRRPDRLGTGLDRRARPRPRLDVDDVRSARLAPELAAGRADIRARFDRTPIAGPAARPTGTWNGIRRSHITASARSPASTSNFIAPASAATPCGNASRHPSRSCSRAASSLPNARPPMTRRKPLNDRFRTSRRTRRPCAIGWRPSSPTRSSRTKTIRGRRAHGARKPCARELVALARAGRSAVAACAEAEYGGLGLDHRGMAVVFEAAGWSTAGSARAEHPGARRRQRQPAQRHRHARAEGALAGAAGRAAKSARCSR